jgi:hypothetical protein
MQRNPFIHSVIIPALLLCAGVFLPCRASAQCRAIEPARVPVDSRSVRSLEDRGTGQRWLLLAPDRFPGGPGTWISWDERRNAGHVRPEAALALPVAVIVHSGDRLSLVDSTGMAKALFDAVALGPAAIGQSFPVRLIATGHTLRAVATGHGCAEIAPQTEGEK